MFYVTWRKIIRRLWNVPYKTHCRLLPVLLDDYSIDIQLMLRFSEFILKAYQSENSLISLCTRLTYYSNTPVANNYRTLGHLLNTNFIFNYQYNNMKLRIVNNSPIHNDTPYY